MGATHNGAAYGPRSILSDTPSSLTATWCHSVAQLFPSPSVSLATAALLHCWVALTLPLDNLANHGVAPPHTQGFADD